MIFYKIKAIFNENILFINREKLIILPCLIYLFGIGLFILNKGLFKEVEKLSFVSFFSFLNHFLLLIPFIYISIQSYNKDILTKNIYLTLKSVNRTEYILGKIFSTIIYSLYLNIIHLIIFLIGYLYLFKNIDYHLLYLFIFNQFEIIIFILFSFLISIIIEKNIIRIFFIILFYIAGHSLYWIKVFIDNKIIDVNKYIENIFIFFYSIIPNLEIYNIRDIILYTKNINSFFGISILYTIVLSFILYSFIYLFFKKKEL